MPIKLVSPNIAYVKKGSISAVAVFTALSATVPAYAAIDNTATAFGTFGTADDTQDSDSASVPVVNNRSMTIAKSVFTAPDPASGGADNTIIDAGDTIVYRYTVTNTGALTEDNVTITDVGPTFNGVAGTPANLSAIAEITGAGAGTGDAATLAPGETVVFEATYTLTALDILNAAGVTDGVSNIATASSDDLTAPPDTPTSPPAETTIPARTGITIAKSFAFTTDPAGDNLAEAGDVVTYTYTVENTGNVALTNVRVDDLHEGTLLTANPAGPPTAEFPRNEAITIEGALQPSDLGAANDGFIARLEAGAIATFTYAHTVTQAEVDG